MVPTTGTVYRIDEIAAEPLTLNGILWLQETLSMRLIIASAMILGGIGIAVLGRHQE
ncbi:MAG: hypothetical protein VKJ64_05740 [Leptolyngbyaceae bacterium]|nr:hypothetical protein [Leptolyngbyaceae bacterium]